MLGMISLTYYSYLFCSGAAVAAVLYFIIQTPRLQRSFRLLAVLNILICGFSAVLHFYYFNTLQPGMDAGAPPEALIRTITQLPLEIRYSYWLITTVMLIIMFPLLIGLSKVGPAFLVQLAAADAGMIIAGYFGERSMLAAGEVTNTAMVLFLVGVGLWLFMLITIYTALRRLPSGEIPPPLRDTLAYMYFFILLGWTIYPAGYFHGVFFEENIGIVLREFTFNLGDIVNKIIWGLLVVSAARTVSHSLGQEVSS